jgi:hypothetical protein
MAIDTKPPWDISGSHRKKDFSMIDDLVLAISLAPKCNAEMMRKPDKPNNGHCNQAQATKAARKT